MTGAGPARRIVVAIDSSAGAGTAIEAATELARRLHAEVTALFVEDVELVRLAALPFAREIGSDAEARPFDRPRLERRFRREIREARAACERVAERARVRVRFEVTRGAVAHEILAAAEEADMVVLGRAGTVVQQDRAARASGASARRGVPLGRTTLSVLSSATRTVAVVTPARSIARPVAVVYDGGEASQRALELAVRLAGEDHHNLVVLVPGDETRARELGARAADTARDRGIEPRCEALPGGAGSIARAIFEHNCGALVVSRTCALIENGGISGLIERLDCPVFVVG